MRPATTDLAIRSPSALSLGALPVDSPAELVKTATGIAQQLRKVIDDRGLAVKIQDREYVRCEGWTTCAAMLGITAREVGVVEVKDEFVATVELVRADGHIVGRASASCSTDEKLWSKRPRHARRSMALTRATSKAARLAFSWIITLSGYAPTPYEEMDQDDPEPAAAPPPARRRTRNTATAAPQVLGEHGAQRLLAKLKSIDRNWQNVLDDCETADPSAWERLTGVALEDIPAALIPNVRASLDRLESTGDGRW
jgi:hypothetical protein